MPASVAVSPARVEGVPQRSISSASRGPETLSEIPTSVTIATAERITRRRSEGAEPISGAG